MLPGYDWSKFMSIMKLLSLSKDTLVKLRLVTDLNSVLLSLYVLLYDNDFTVLNIIMCLQVNGIFAATPFYLNNGTVNVYESGFSVIVSTHFGLEVSYDTNHYVRISVPYTYQNATCGLCGNFNNDPRDDFRTRQGEVVSSDVVFANSWQVSGDDEPGCEPPCAGPGCHQQLPPQTFVESCVYDLCVGGGYQPILCQALSVYASQCQQNGIQLPSWRRPGFCEIPCPANSHFESQGTGCPATCVNPNSTQNCPLPPQESCICNAGYILSAGVCVPHAECGCSFEGRYYRSGETVILDEDCGRRCSCSYGSMTCQSFGCGPLESCSVEEGERGCRPNSYATCWTSGPGSYHMFDGLTYQYPGACRLTLAKVMGLSSQAHFMVTAEKVDGQLIKLPFSSASNQIQIYHSSIHSITLRTSFGVTLQTVLSNFVRITAPVVYSGSLGGLCGNYNGQPDDDFRTPSGLLVNSSQEFGDSWRDGSLVNGSEVCGSTDDKNDDGLNDCPFREEYSELCGVITNTSGSFSSCHLHSDPTPFFIACVYDLCLYTPANGMLCSSVSAYEKTCSVLGLDIPEWRSALQCGITLNI
uniref:VWFD domain-containing protein n=1 Tax=Monopterus albus TaxID=43700 RepID=A0A3Q3RAZ7_MONAL